METQKLGRIFTLKDREKRNNRLINFFKEKNFPVKLVGNENSPAIIFANDVCLSCYVHNFNLIFMDKPFKGTELFRVKLTHIVTKDFDIQFIDWIENAEHRAVYVIYFWLDKFKENLLHLTGFNKNDKNKSYPVFAEFNPKIYFTLEAAKNVVKEFSSDNLKLQITNND